MWLQAAGWAAEEGSEVSGARHYRVSRGQLETLNGPTKRKRKRSRKREKKRVRKQIKVLKRKQRKSIKR